MLRFSQNLQDLKSEDLRIASYPKWGKYKTPMPKHIIVKLLNTKKKTLKAVNRKNIYITFKEIRISFRNNGSQKTMVNSFNMPAGGEILLI